MTKWDTIQTDILPVVPRSWDLEDEEDFEDDDFSEESFDKLLKTLGLEI